MDTQNRRHSKKFYEDAKNVREFIEATEGLDGGYLIEILKNHLKPDSTVLEIGMGAGRDLNILRETFQAVGSDYSRTFLDLYKQKNPTADLILLDAATLETNRKFDCIYSNKVLHHLSTEDLQKSLEIQKTSLNKNGILFHTFWKGIKKNEYQDLHFNQYELKELAKIFKKEYDFVAINFYTELLMNDSIYIVVKI